MAPDAVSPRNVRVFAALAAARIVLFTVLKLFTPLIIRSVLDMCSMEALFSSFSDFSTFVVDTAPELPSIMSTAVFQLCTTTGSAIRPYLPQAVQDFDFLGVTLELLSAVEEYLPEPPIKFCVLGSGIGCGPVRRRRTFSDLAGRLVSYLIDKARLPHGLVVDVFSKVFSGTCGVVVCSILLFCCFAFALAWSLWTLDSFETPLDEEELRVIIKVDAALAPTVNRVLAILTWLRRRSSTALTSIPLLYHGWKSVHSSANGLISNDGVLSYGQLLDSCRRIFSLVPSSSVARYLLVAGVLAGILGVVCYVLLFIWVIWAANHSRAELATTRPTICNTSGDLINGHSDVSEQLNVNAIATPDVATQAYESAPGPSALYPENDDTTCANRSPNVTSSTAELAQNADLQAGEIATSTTETHQNNIASASTALDDLPKVLAKTLSARFPEGYYIHPEFTEKYELVNELGAGSFGFVIQGRRREDGRHVAVKFLCKTQDERKIGFDWNDHPVHGRVPPEVRFLRSLRHQNIVEMLDLYSDDTYVYIILELHGGCWLPRDERDLEYWPSGGDRSLFGYLAQNGPMSLKDAKYVFKQLARVERYLFMNGMSHCDIKPENIVIDESLKVKLIDFGSAIFYGRGITKQPLLYHPETYGGTRIYMPPEIHEGKPYRTAPGDVWALGVVLYQMLTGERPFWDVEMVKRGTMAYNPSNLENMDDLLMLWPVISGCLEMDPERRLSPIQLYTHPCLQ